MADTLHGTTASGYAGSINAGARLDRLPPSAFHRRVIALIGIGMFLDACDIYLAPGVLGALVQQGWSNVATNALFLSMTFLGMLVGTLGSGFVGDRYGRRFSYQINLVIFGVASLLAAVAPNMTVLIVLRFIMGIGLGAEIVVGYASLTEFVPPSLRGRYASMLSAITNFSVAAIAFLGLWIIPTIGWRYMFVIIGVASGIVWVLRKNMPESPRWLESRGRLAEAEAVLASIEAEIGAKTPLPPVRPVPVVAPEPFSDLFGPRLRGRLAVGAVISAVGMLSLYGFLAWVPTFLVSHGFALTRSLGFTALMGLGAPIGAIVAAVVADRFSRPRLIFVFTLLEAALGAAYPFVGSGVELVLVGFGLTLSAYVLVALTTALYIPELFPTALRMRGTALINSVGRLTATLVQFIIAAAFAGFGVAGVAGLLVVALVIQAVVVVVWGPNTSDRSLEDIAVSGGGAGAGVAAPALGGG